MHFASSSVERSWTVFGQNSQRHKDERQIKIYKKKKEIEKERKTQGSGWIFCVWFFFFWGGGVGGGEELTNKQKKRGKRRKEKNYRKGKKKKERAGKYCQTFSSAHHIFKWSDQLCSKWGVPLNGSRGLNLRRVISRTQSLCRRKSWILSAVESAADGYRGMLLQTQNRRPLIHELKCTRRLWGHQLKNKQKKKLKTGRRECQLLTPSC